MGRIRVTCSCVGFHVIAMSELFRVVVAFCLLSVCLVWFGFSLPSDYVFVIWGLRAGDVSRVSYLPLSGVCMCVFHKDLSGKRWTSLYLFWLTDKYYIVVGFLNITSSLGRWHGNKSMEVLTCSYEFHCLTVEAI